MVGSVAAAGKTSNLHIGWADNGKWKLHNASSCAMATGVAHGVAYLTEVELELELLSTVWEIAHSGAARKRRLPST